MTTKLKKQFAVSTDKVFPFTQQEGAVVDTVPAAYYHVEFSSFVGFFLVRKADKAPVPAELFGSTVPRAEMIMDTYNRKEQGIGIGLFGAKGAGKTLLSNVLANMLIDQGLPVVDVSGLPEYSQELLEFLNSLGECGIIFDEFFKALKNQQKDDNNMPAHRAIEKGQERMLTFFSGTNKSKRLVILIDNYSAPLNDFFVNRPSRLRYIFNYSGVEAEIVKALASKAHLNESTTEALVTYAIKHACTFDMINELIDEIVHNKCIDADNVDLAAICNYFNAPKVRHHFERKVRVSTFVPNENSRTSWLLDNELAIETDEHTLVTIKCAVPWPANKMSEDEFDAFEETHGENPLRYDYEDYADNWHNISKGYITRTLNLHPSTLVSIKGATTTYSNDYGTFSIVDDIEPLPAYNFAFM